MPKKCESFKAEQRLRCEQKTPCAGSAAAATKQRSKRIVNAVNHCAACSAAAVNAMQLYIVLQSFPDGF